MTATAPTLLVADREPTILQAVRDIATHAGFDVVTASSAGAAIRTSQQRQPAVAMIDLLMHDVERLAVVRTIHDYAPGCQVVLMTEGVQVETVADGLAGGALECSRTPLDVVHVKRLLDTAREAFTGRHRTEAAQPTFPPKYCGMIGTGPIMQQVFRLIGRVAPFNRSTLISGETGTGKELVARALHQAGRRSDHRFVTINCSALVETLVESELFGHTRGAFTGATETKPGLFEVADEGIIFLDEVAELSLSIQAKLLRVLELGEIQPLGGLKTRRVNVQVLAATNRDLGTEVTGGRFRTDLFYRLNVVDIHLPALRERHEDISPLADSFIAECAARWKTPPKSLTIGARTILGAAPWPGNIRELRNVIERACMLTDGPLIDDRALAACMPARTSALPALSSSGPEAAPVIGGDTTPSTLAAMERAHIVLTLAHAHGNKESAARLLGISRRSLYNRMERLGLWNPVRRGDTLESQNGHGKAMALLSGDPNETAIGGLSHDGS